MADFDFRAGREHVAGEAAEGDSQVVGRLAFGEEGGGHRIACFAA